MGDVSENSAPMRACAEPELGRINFFTRGWATKTGLFVSLRAAAGL